MSPSFVPAAQDALAPNELTLIKVSQGFLVPQGWTTPGPCCGGSGSTTTWHDPTSLANEVFQISHSGATPPPPPCTVASTYRNGDAVAYHCQPEVTGMDTDAVTNTYAQSSGGDAGYYQTLTITLPRAERDFAVQILRSYPGPA